MTYKHFPKGLPLNSIIFGGQDLNTWYGRHKYSDHSIKHTNIHIVRDPEGKREREERIFEENGWKTSQIWLRYKYKHVSSMNFKKNKQRYALKHIKSNCLKTKNLENIKTEAVHHIQGVLNKINRWFLRRNYRKQWDDMFKVLNGGKKSTNNLISNKTILQKWKIN